MEWAIVAVLCAIAIIAASAFVYKAARPERSPEARKAATPAFLGAIGGLLGALTGIVLVEFAGFEYPFPFILFMLGMAAGQIAGVAYTRLKKP
jgi:uncharacterized membrane protein YfcA